jgi:methanethiol S-methyltransferase
MTSQRTIPVLANVKYPDDHGIDRRSAQLLASARQQRADHVGTLVAALVTYRMKHESKQEKTMAGFVAVLYGIGAYAVFLVSLLYAIGFVGDVVVPKTIDSGAPGPLLVSVIINTMLLGLFAAQHSVMARPGFKRWWTRFVPRSIERSTYVLLASLVLLLLFWQWRPIPEPVWTVQNPIAVAAVTAIFWLGWGMLLVSTCLISHFELFGLTQVFARLLGREASAPRFHTPLLYRHVRHPIYLSFLLSFWAAPSMTVGHLLFSVATTGYILIAIQLEERDLIGLFGEQYRRYRQNVAMLLPLPGRRPDASAESPASSPERSPL